MASPDPSPAAGAARASVTRRFGHYELLELLGRSTRTMAWRARDLKVGLEVVLAMPRAQPAATADTEEWLHAVRKVARLQHPNLAAVIEVGVHDRWPYAAYETAGEPTLAQRVGSQGLTARDAAQCIAQAAQGVAFAHAAGAVHGDLQAWQLLVADSGHTRVLGTEVALDASAAAFDEFDTSVGAVAAQNAERLRLQRTAARRDVLTLGLLLHLALAGAPALDEADTGIVVDRLPPTGRDIVRLPWSVPRPIPDPLRAIVNRATDRQARQRYGSARTLIGALEGWLQADAAAGGEPLALLLDRLHSVGLLPSMPGAAERAARLALMERERTNELAEIVLQDLALAFEMLRAVNTAQVRGVQVSGNGPVLTIRRSIAMLGLDGVRRAALALRPWPGPLDETGARALEREVWRVKRVGRVAQALRPPGYDAEVVYLVTLLQNLGRLVVHYHFPDEAQQIKKLMEPAPAEVPGERDEPGMSEEAAAFAVLGVDIESIGSAVARHWGLDESVLHMIRRLPVATAVHTIGNDDDMLRAVASCANEAVDAAAQPAAQAPAAIARVAQRYGRPLKLTPKDLQNALVHGPTGRADGDDAFDESGIPTLDDPILDAPAGAQAQ
jgi:non-specific serine/threonine protein kinase